MPRLRVTDPRSTAAHGSGPKPAAGPPPFFDRGLHYDGLRPEAAVRLEAAGRDAAQRTLLELNRLALSLLEEGEAQPGTPTRRVNIGIYVYAEDEASPPLRTAPRG